MFTSTFCSKCLYNRKLWKEVTNGDPELLEINIAHESNKKYLEKFEPKISPTIMILDNTQIIYAFAGVLNSKIVHSILDIYRHLSQ